MKATLYDHAGRSREEEPGLSESQEPSLPGP